MSKLQTINQKIIQYADKYGRKAKDIELLAVTKQKTLQEIIPLLTANHKLFGENRVQEAYTKWPTIKKRYPFVKLHLIGHLQKNKVKEAIALFDTIQTLDSLHLADKLAIEEQRQGRNLTYLVEINIGNEPQKTGIYPDQFNPFITELRANYPLAIQGIMCIPPLNEEPRQYFKQMKQIALTYKLPVISMGMSRDFEVAIECGATMLRIGTALF